LLWLKQFVVLLWCACSVRVYAHSLQVNVQYAYVSVFEVSVHVGEQLS